MLTLDRHAAKLVNFNARAEKHGEEPVSAADLHFSFDTVNDVLLSFDPSLKSSLYRKPEGDDDQPDLLGGPQQWLPKLRFPAIEAIKWKAELKDMQLVIHAGTRGDTMLDAVTVGPFKLEPLDGGSVSVTFRVQCHPSEAQVGRLFTLIERTVEVTLRRAPLPDQKPDGWPFPEAGAGAAAEAGAPA